MLTYTELKHLTLVVMNQADRFQCQAHDHALFDRDRPISGEVE
jgi:hypothetical protein